MRSTSKSSRFLARAVATVLVGGFAAESYGQVDTTATQSGNWSDSQNPGGASIWSFGEPTNTAVGSPNGAATNAIINGGLTVTIDQAGETAALVDLGTGAAGNSGNLTITAGDLTVSNADAPNAGLPSIRVGQAAGNTGTFTMSGGTVTVTGAQDSGFANGDLMIGDVGAGIMNMSGGTATVSDEIVIGLADVSTGTVNLSGGSLNTSATTGRSALVGFDGNGTLNVTGTGSLTTRFDTAVGFLEGSVGNFTLADSGTVTSNFMFSNFLSGGTGSTATITQTGGTFNARLAYVLGQGVGTTTMTHSGGAINAGTFVVSDGGGNTSTYDLSGDATVNLLENVFVAAFAGSNGTINQTGGTISAGGFFSVGRGAVGNWNHSAGTNTVANVFLGDFDNSTGNYRLSGGTLNVTGNLSVGGALASNAPPAPTGTQGQALNADGILTIRGSAATITVGGNLLASPGDNTRFGGAGEHNDAALVFEFLDATGTSLLDIAGLADLTGAVIDVDALNGFVLTQGNSYKLLNATSISSDYVQAAEDIGLYTLSVAPDPTLGGQTLFVSAVPEPASLALFGLAGLGLLARRRHA